MNKTKLPESIPPSNQSGFTIIESLLAIIVVTILMIGVAPILTLAVANRVQAKRVEQATQAARSYLDGVRSGAISFGGQDTSKNRLISDTALTPGKVETDNLSYVDVPDRGALTCLTDSPDKPGDRNYCTSPTLTGSVLYCVDGDNPSNGCDGTGNKDFIIQAFGKIFANNSGELANGAQGYRSYSLGVRVYRADAFKSEFVKEFTKGEVQSSFTGGLGISEKQAPLVQMATEVVVKDLTQFRNLCETRTPKITGC